MASTPTLSPADHHRLRRIAGIRTEPASTTIKPDDRRIPGACAELALSRRGWCSFIYVSRIRWRSSGNPLGHTLPYQEFDFGVGSFDRAVAVGQGEPGHDGVEVLALAQRRWSGRISVCPMWMIESGWCVSDLIRMLYPQLAALVIDEVVDQGREVHIQARTRPTAVPCPDCGCLTKRVHAYHQRQLAAVPAAGRGMVIGVRVRRLICLNTGCVRRTFREQIPTIARRWARRTVQLTELIADIAVAMAGRAGAALLSRLGTRVSRSTVLRVLMALPAGRVASAEGVERGRLRVAPGTPLRDSAGGRGRRPAHRRPA